VAAINAAIDGLVTLLKRPSAKNSIVCVAAAKTAAEWLSTARELERVGLLDVEQIGLFHDAMKNLTSLVKL
jgi:hypothetical protein